MGVRRSQPIYTASYASITIRLEAGSWDIGTVDVTVSRVGSLRTFHKNVPQSIVVDLKFY